MRRGLAALAVAVAVVLLVPATAHARAGGGHSSGGHSSGGTSHSTGGSSGGSSGGTSGGGTYTGSSGSGSGTPLGPVASAIVFGILLLLGGFWVYSKITGASEGIQAAADDYMAAAHAEQEESEIQVAQGGLAAIQANDAGFELHAFLDRATRTFTLAQQAWSDRNLAAVRPFMGQGTYLSWESQIGQMAKRHEKDVMQNVKVENATIVRAVRGPYEHITVKFDASAIDYTVDDRNGAMLTGSKSAEPFTEYWTFERAGTTATLQKAGALEQKCPNCGGPLSVNAIGECTYCKAAVTNGTYDWVLQRIDQENYWNGG
jgi:hypothetical protein